MLDSKPSAYLPPSLLIVFFISSALFLNPTSILLASWSDLNIQKRPKYLAYFDATIDKQPASEWQKPNSRAKLHSSIN